ncbi:MAG TPA: adenylate/guanylate cyclase domain-containing protein [Acidimicrobiales bacterium]|nr:adenylate/guanylate cyclase domain-containing protein [Acidimicrobiales bacterium]
MRADGLNIAYQVVGDGPFDLVYVPGFVSNVELSWEEPLFALFLERLASFSRLILFDKRGTGMSDRVPTGELPSLEERVDDLTAVLDAVGSDEAALFSHSEGGNVAVMFAATYPERTRALVTAGIFAKRVRSEDYPWAPTTEERARAIEQVEADWGGTSWLIDLVPSCADDEPFKARLASYFRQSASPGAAAALFRMNTNIDIRSVLPTISVPTMVMHRIGDRDANIEEGRWIAARIPGARFIELAGEDHIPWVGDAQALLDLVEEFLTGGVQGTAEFDRVLASVLFTDIVGSTKMASALGDRRWRELLDSHDKLTRSYVEKYRGRVVKSTGDGALAIFDGPARSVRCASALRDALAGLGIALRAGIHTGEIEQRGDDVGGIAVHIAARVQALAEPGQVLVSRTVTDLVAGSGLEFDDLGEHYLKGIPGARRLYAVGGQRAGA